MPRTKPVTQEQKQAFIAALSDGQPRASAARLAHPDHTSSAFRRHANRDPEFAAQVEAAEREGHAARGDRISNEIQARAFNPATAGSARLLELLAATYAPDFSWLRTKGQPDSPGGDEDQLLPMVNTELLTAPQLERLAELRDEMIVLIEMGQGKRPNPLLETKTLPPADPSTNGSS